MSWLSEFDIFTIGLTLLKLLGEHIDYTPRKVILYRIINWAVYIIVLTFIAGNLSNSKSEGFITTLEDFTTVFHTFFKYSMFIYNKGYLKELLDARREKFWKISGENKNLSKRIRKIYEGINLLEIVMVFDVIVVVELYILIPYLNPSNTYIFASNVFVNSIVMDVLVLFCQYYVICVMGCIVLAYDFVYLCLCIELVVQVKLLKAKLREVFTKSNEDAVFGVYTCVEQHNFLLSIHEKIQKMYSNVLLFHYFVSLATVCFDMYQSFIGEADLSHDIQKFMSLAGIVAQFAFYCVPAEWLSSEFTDIAQALYMSRWFKSTPHIQKLMLPIMVKCQKPHYFSAAGLLDINVDAFGSVIRKAFSFCAVIRNLLDK